MYKDTIDTQKGLAYMTGKKEIYIRIAGIFTKNVDTKIAELRQYFDNGDFARLTLEFHGMKSSSASIGSTLLPQIAQELEKAGKEGDTELIKEKFEAFIEQFRDTCAAVDEAAALL